MPDYDIVDCYVIKYLKYAPFHVTDHNIYFTDAGICKKFYVQDTIKQVYVQKNHVLNTVQS